MGRTAVCWLLILGTMPPPEQRVGTMPERQVWEVVRSADGDFAFAMPTKPVAETRNVQDPGGPGEILTYSCQVHGCLYRVQRTRTPQSVAPSEAIAALARRRKDFFPENVRLVQETQIVLDGVPGEDFTYSAPSSQGEGDMTKRTRHYLQGRSYYVLTVASPAGQPLPEDATRFLSSMTFEALVQAHSAGNQVEPGPRVEPADSTPEDVLKTFLLALAAGEEAILRAVALPDPEFDWLLAGRPEPPERIVQLKARLDAQPIRRLKAGDPVRMPGGEIRVIKPDDVREGRVVLWPEGAPLPSRIENVSGHWKVFARPFIAARKAVGRRGRRGQPKSLGSRPGTGR